MTLNQLRYFQVLSQVQHIGQAAEKLYISPPSLSVSIGKLEEELGVALFDRTGHRLSLTEAGNAFLLHTQKILRELREAELHMSRLSRQQETKIRLGCITPLLRDYLPRKMREFMRLPENQKVEFEFSIANTGELVRRLKNGVYDLLLCSASEDEEVAQVPILTEPLVFLSSADDPIPGSWSELAELPLIGYEQGSVMDVYLREIAAQNGVKLSFRYRAPTETAIASLVEHGFGCAVIPWSEAQLSGYEIRRSPIPGVGRTREIFLTTLRGQSSQGVAQRFIRFLQSEPEQ